MLFCLCFVFLSVSRAYRLPLVPYSPHGPVVLQDGRFVQLGDNGKLLEQGTEVEVVPPPKRAINSRQVRIFCLCVRA